MPDSGKFKDLYLNSAHTYPCQPTIREVRRWGANGSEGCSGGGTRDVRSGGGVLMVFGKRVLKRPSAVNSNVVC